MKNRVITISREFGSGGRTIGKKVAEELGLPCYDSELIEKTAEKSGFHVSYIKDAGEYAPGGFLASALSHRTSGPNNADYLWKIQYNIITELAEKGPCVIVGRCADYILKDNPNCINVFICADRADRIKRIAERYDVSEKKALDRIKRMDRERKYYYETHTGQEWGSISSHDILLNASLLGIEGTVNVLEGIYKR